MQRELVRLMLHGREAQNQAKIYFGVSFSHFHEQNLVKLIVFK